MIFVSYPCGTGGNFISALLAHLKYNSVNYIDRDGSLHGRDSTISGYKSLHHTLIDQI